MGLDPVGRLRARAERAERDREAARAVERALAESAGDGVARRAGPATAGGDRERLRGIPAIGRGVSGAIRGSDPARDGARRADRSG